jgi:hypothetical protein
MPGWHEVPTGTTLADVEQYVEIVRLGKESKVGVVDDFSVRDKNASHPAEMNDTTTEVTLYVLSSDGETLYNVVVIGEDDSDLWVCNCLGFSYRRRCRHIKEAWEDWQRSKERAAEESGAKS